MTVSACISGNLPSCHHPSIHPSILYPLTTFLVYTRLYPRSPVGRTLVLVRLVVRSSRSSSDISKKSKLKIVFPVFHACLPHFPIFPFSLPVSFRRFSSFRASAILPYPIPVLVPVPARPQAFGRPLRASARGCSISLPRWLPQPARIAPISSPDCSFTTHAGLFAVPRPYHDSIARLPFPRLRSGLQPASISTTVLACR